MIIKVEAIIREEKLQDVLDALGEMEVHGCRKLSWKYWFLRKNGKRKRWKRFRKQHIPETSGTEKFSAMMYGMPCGFVPKKLGLEQFSRNK